MPDRRAELAKQVWAIPQVRRDVLYIIGEFYFKDRKDRPLLLDKSTLEDTLRPLYATLYMSDYLKMMRHYVYPARLSTYLGLVRELDLRGSFPALVGVNGYTEIQFFFPNLKRITSHSTSLTRLSAQMPIYQLLTTTFIPCTSQSRNLPRSAPHGLPPNWTIIRRHRLVYTCPFGSVGIGQCTRTTPRIVPDLSGMSDVLSIQADCGRSGMERRVCQLVESISDQPQFVEMIGHRPQQTDVPPAVILEIEFRGNIVTYINQFIGKFSTASAKCLDKLDTSKAIFCDLPTIHDIFSLVPWCEFRNLTELRIAVRIPQAQSEEMYTESPTCQDILHLQTQLLWKRRKERLGQASGVDQEPDNWCQEDHHYHAPTALRSLPVYNHPPLQSLRLFHITVQIDPAVGIDIANLRLSELVQRLISVGGRTCAYSLRFETSIGATPSVIAYCAWLNKVVPSMFKAEVELALDRDGGVVGWKRVDKVRVKVDRMAKLE